MPRLPRVVAEHLPHHIVQRGHRRQRVFFSDEDKTSYLKLLRRHAGRHGVSFWAYCLMDNHVHFIAVPERAESLAWCFPEAHKAYTRQINFRKGWRGGMWESRFKNFPLDEPYLDAAIRYVERNPVKARMVAKAEDDPFSSARSHVYKTPDLRIDPCFLEDNIQDWAQFLKAPGDGEACIQKHINTGRPLGSPSFVERIEKLLHRSLKKQRPGPKKVIK